MRKQTPKQLAESHYRGILMKALDNDEENANEHLIEYAVKQARSDNTLLSAIMKKLLPDLKSIDAKVEGESPYKLIIELPRPASKSKGRKIKDGKQDKQD